MHPLIAGCCRAGADRVGLVPETMVPVSGACVCAQALLAINKVQQAKMRDRFIAISLKKRQSIH
nr:hypothetical protein [Alcaligenes faecalis]